MRGLLEYSADPDVCLYTFRCRPTYDMPLQGNRCRPPVNLVRDSLRHIPGMSAIFFVCPDVGTVWTRAEEGGEVGAWRARGRCTARFLCY